MSRESQTLRTLGRFVLLLLLLVCIANTVAYSKGEELTELQKLKAENFKLKVQVAQLQATLQDRENKLISIELTSDQSKLEKEFRESLKADDKEKFDWDKLIFTAAPPK